MVDVIQSEIERAQIQIGREFPFYADIMLRLDLIDATETKWCRTLATDGLHLYYNRSFLAELTRRQLIFGLLHEILHAVEMHGSRRYGRDPGYWNMATDYVINYELIHNCNKSSERIANILYSEEFTNEMSAEEVYHILVQRQVQIAEPLDQHIDFGEDDDADGGEGDTPGDGEGKEGKAGDGMSSKITIDATGSQLDPNKPPKLTPRQMRQAQRQIRDSIVASISRHGAGNVPLGARRYIKEITEPQIDWRDYLISTVQSAFTNNYAWHRPHRYAHTLDFILPGEDPGEEVEIAIALDASGSIGESELQDFLGETWGVMGQYSDYVIHLWSFDSEAQEDSYMRITPENIDDFFKFRVKGGGGTMFQEGIWDFIAKQEWKVSKTIVMTDMWPNTTWGEPSANAGDVLWIAHNTKTIVGPYGTTVPYIPSANKKTIKL